MDEDEGPHEDLNEHEMSEEASDSDEGQQEFEESSDEISADDNNSQGQQDELGISTNFLFGNVAIWKGGARGRARRRMLVVSRRGVKVRILVSLRVFWAKRNHIEL